MNGFQLDRLDRLILNTIQNGFPVAPRPYQVLAEKLAGQYEAPLTEDEIWRRVKALKDNGYIRRLGAIFNAAPLGYRSTLCAARVPQPKLEKFSELVNKAPQVTHNYLRSDDLNVWFTFSANRPEALDEFLAELKQSSGVEEIHVLEAEKLFKIKVDFKFSDN
ncbi:Lrp/AsnC family transcriptional regulator [Deltaproteobacteria bacterium OttesenSCG-928-K17]|nr:Lrp/AsnC family transcriptional regulator [Deltaproteobacteria bacterium OttesenSCG-928-K17]